jgi:hypothetical protein
VHRGRPGRAVAHGEPRQHVVGACLRILHEHVEVTVAVERARIAQLVLRVALVSPAVLVHQRGVRERALRVL